MIIITLLYSATSHFVDRGALQVKIRVPTKYNNKNNKITENKNWALSIMSLDIHAINQSVI